MNLRRLLFRPFLPAVLLTLTGCAAIREPQPNLTLYKWQLIHWHDSGDYDRLFAEKAGPALRALDRILKGPIIPNYAVVLDIDETALSNWHYLRVQQFAIAIDTFSIWTRAARAPALAPTLQLYSKAKAAGIPVFFITGRPESLRDATIRDLHEAGYFAFDGLFMKPDDYRLESIIPFKSSVRKRLADHGYEIVLNLGDQWSDLEGGHAERTFKLPNPFYYIP